MKPLLIELPFPILTPRLLIRPPQPGDGKMNYEARMETLESLKVWLPWARLPDQSTEMCEEFCRFSAAKVLLREDLPVFMFDRANGQFLGGCGLHRINWEHRQFMIGYWIRASATGKGYVTEVANALTRYAFQELKARRVEITCNVENEKSAAIPNRLGYQLETIMRDKDMFASADIKNRDEYLFARTNLDGLPALEVKW